MGCIHTSNVPKEVHNKERVQMVQAILDRNLPKVKKLVRSNPNIDFTNIYGCTKSLEFGDIVFDLEKWGPLLLSIYVNSLELVQYFVEEMDLNLEIFLIKPPTDKESELLQDH